MESDPRFGKSSASRLHIIVNCPGQKQLWDSIKGEGGGEYEPPPDASFGNAVHAAWAGNISEMSLSERQQVVKKKADQIKARLISEVFGDNPVTTFVETRFKLYDKMRQPIHSAQIDWVGYHNGTWLCLDLKSLYGDQEPADQNWQLLSQAVCIGDDDEVRNQNGEAPINEIICGIVQPLITLKPELVKYDAHSLARAKVLILRKLDEAETPGAPLIPGRHCKFCPCSKQCPVQVADLMAVEKRGTLNVNTLTPEMVANILPHIPSLMKRIEEFRDHAKKLASDGLLPGYEIKTQEGNRFCQSQESIKQIHEALADYIPVEAIRKLVELPFGKLREAFIEAAVSKDRSDKVTAGQLFDSLTEGKWQRGSPSKRLSKTKTI